jgi:hypothetical protein
MSELGEAAVESVFDAPMCISFEWLNDSEGTSPASELSVRKRRRFTIDIGLTAQIKGINGRHLLLLSDLFETKDGSSR